MSDSMQTEKRGFDALSSSPFFTFSKPYLNFIGKGTMFNLVYIVMAIVSLLFPIAVIFLAIEMRIFDYGARGIIFFIFSWLVVAFAGWIGFQLWWDRKSQIMEVKDSEFVATPIVSDIFRTFGEWTGTLIAIIGAGVGFFGLIIFPELLRYIPYGGPLMIIAGPIVGFFIIVFSRFLAEQLRVFAAIANNTRSIAQK